MPDLSQLGFTTPVKELYESEQINASTLARVIREHKELYVIQHETGSYNAEITGNMRFTAESRKDFPAVGDWVEAAIFDGGQAIINKILPRFSLLERQSVSTHGEKQIIASNINIAFIVQAVDRDFNLNRLERYVVIAHNGGIIPVVILNKSDLISADQLSDLKKGIAERIKNIQIFSTSTYSSHGLDELLGFLKMGETYCFVGSSGVGKSTIINHLIGEEFLDTKEISIATNKGKHTTTHRELVLMRNGSILIDTPGMREIGMTDSISGMEMTFSDIVALAKGCRFNNCTHTDEPGCEVIKALEDGSLSYDEYENYKKLERQTEHFTATVAEKRKKDKQFGKLCKGIMKEKKRYK